MGDTYTTSWTTVSDGDTTSINPENLVGTRLNIISAYIEWKGVQTSDTTTTTDYSTNTNTVTAEATTTNTSTDSNNDGATNGTATVQFPSAPSGATVDSHVLEVSSDVINGTAELTFDDITGSSKTVDASGYDYSKGTTINREGESRSASITYVDSGADASVNITAETTYTTSSTDSDTSCTSYPSVPSGYSFSRHYYREEKNGSYQDSDYTYSNNVGDSRCVTSSDPSNTWTLEMRTRGEDDTTTTNYYDTHDPSVSGDVNGSYTGTLNDGSTSGWQSLSGLASGSNTINHNIQESNKAEYRIKFDWENAVPNVKMIRRININGTDYDVALADPTDEALKYNFYRIQTSEGVLAYDIVDPTDAGALPKYIQHPDHGKVAFREYTE